MRLSAPLALILGAGFLLRFASGLARPPAFYAHDDYVDLAGSLARHGGLQDAQGRPSAQREPAYPAALAVVFKLLGPGYASVLLLNCVLGTATLWLMHSLAGSLFGRRAAWLAAGTGAVYPPFLFYASYGMREVMLAFACLLCLWLLREASRRGRPAWFAAGGAAAALAALTKSTFLPFALVLAPIGLLVQGRARGFAAARPCAAYLAAFLLLFGLWPLRNAWSLGRFVFGSVEGGGNNLYTYLVVPQEAGGTPLQTEILARDAGYQDALGVADPVERDRRLWRLAIRRVRESPAAYARLVAWRLFWDLWRPVPRPRAYEVSYGLVRAASLLTDSWIIPLGLAGAVWAGWSLSGGFWLPLFLLSESVVYSLVFTMIRYRFAMMPVLILCAAAVLDRGWTWARGRRPA